MLPRLLASRAVLLFYLAQTLVMTVLVAIDQLRRLLQAPRAVVIHDVLEDSETIGVLLIATGVVLECREILLKRAAREAGQDDEALHTTVEERDVEYYGVVLLILGLTIELIVAITDWLGVHARATALYGLVEPWFNAITTLNLVVLMAAGMAAMVRVVQVMYLRRRSV